MSITDHGGQHVASSNLGHSERSRLEQPEGNRARFFHSLGQGPSLALSEMRKYVLNGTCLVVKGFLLAFFAYRARVVLLVFWPDCVGSYQNTF